MTPLGAAVTPKDIQALLVSILTPAHKEELQKRRQVDFMIQTKSKIRLRGNAFFQQNGIAVSFRLIPLQIRNFKALGFPEFLYDKVMKMGQGLILVVGPTGQGKSTTLASMMVERNSQRTEHVVTVEDPVEYILPSGKGIVQQREVGHDVLNFQDGIRSALREDPDVLMVGEMRDLETISAALTMAETGHIVFSTLHTNSGPETITRIIDAFPPDQQSQIRSQLASTLSMIISQRLVVTADGKDRTLAYEVLTSNYAVQNYIRQNKIFQIPNVLQTDSSGMMVQFEQSLAGLVLANKISRETAFENAHDPEQLEAILDANA
jgi:twitching motility protein PilT